MQQPKGRAAYVARGRRADAVLQFSASEAPESRARVAGSVGKEEKLANRSNC
jgi:hypothetical protein